MVLLMQTSEKKIMIKHETPHEKLIPMDLWLCMEKSLNDPFLSSFFSCLLEQHKYQHLGYIIEIHASMAYTNIHSCVLIE